MAPICTGNSPSKATIFTGQLSSAVLRRWKSSRLYADPITRLSKILKVRFMALASISRDNSALALTKTAKNLRLFIPCSPMVSKIPNQISLYKPLNIRRNSKRPKKKELSWPTSPTSWPKSPKLNLIPTNPSFSSIQINLSKILHVALSTLSCSPIKIEFLPVVMAKSTLLESEKLNLPANSFKLKSKAIPRKLKKSSAEFQSADF